jgi:hypothetical protein
MKVNHLFADINRTGVYILDYLQVEAAIEGEHLLGVIHGKGHVIETANSCRLLRHNPGSASECTRGGHASDKSSPRNAMFHHTPFKKLWI